MICMVDEAQQVFQGYPEWPFALDNNTGNTSPFCTQSITQARALSSSKGVAAQDSSRLLSNSSSCASEEHPVDTAPVY